jgi:hypothetical protein
MKLQLTINEEHQEVFKLIKQLEEKGNGARGYVPDQLRERLKIIQLLSEHFNEQDPVRLVMKIFRMIHPPEKTEDSQTEKTQENIINNKEKDFLDTSDIMSNYS